MEFRIDGLKDLQKTLAAKPRDFTNAIRTTMTRTKYEWMREAKYRVPVDTGVTRNTILGDVQIGPDDATVSVGSNQKHAPFIEFGTKYIAKGAVAALGTDPEINDAQAIHTWPAKEGNASRSTSHSVNISTGRLHSKPGKRDKVAREIKGKRGQLGMQEQMPWLRPAFMKIRSKVLIWLGDCLKPKK